MLALLSKLMKNPQKMYTVKSFATFALVLLFCLPRHSIAQGTPSKPTVELLTRSAGKTDWVAVAAPAFLDIKQQASVNCSCNKNPVLFAAVAPLLVESEEYTVALTGGIFPPDKQGKCPSMIPISALLISMDRTFEGFIEPNSLTPSDKDVLFSGYLFEQRSPQQNQGAAAPEVALLLKNIPVIPSSECSNNSNTQPTTTSAPELNAVGATANEKATITSFTVKAASAAVSALPDTRWESEKTGQQTALLDPKGRTAPALPEKANVSSSVTVDTPCSSSGFDTHPDQDRAPCDGRMVTAFDAGPLTLIYNSKDTSSQLWGISGLSHSFNYRIKFDPQKKIITEFQAPDSTKRELIGDTSNGFYFKNPFWNFWGDFKIFYNELKATSTYATEGKNRLNFTKEGDVFYLSGLSRGDKKPFGLKGTLNEPKELTFTNGTKSVKFTISHVKDLVTITDSRPKSDPDRRHDVKITFKNGFIETITNGNDITVVAVRPSTNGRVYPVAIHSGDAKKIQLTDYFGFDSTGTIVFAQKGLTTYDISYPKGTTNNFIVSRDQSGRTETTAYASYGPYVLPAYYSINEGNVTYQYADAPYYQRTKHSDPRYGSTSELLSSNWTEQIRSLELKDLGGITKQSSSKGDNAPETITDLIERTDLLGNLISRTTSVSSGEDKSTATFESGKYKRVVISDSSGSQTTEYADGKLASDIKATWLEDANSKTSTVKDLLNGTTQTTALSGTFDKSFKLRKHLVSPSYSLLSEVQGTKAGKNSWFAQRIIENAKQIRRKKWSNGDSGQSEETTEPLENSLSWIKRTFTRSKDGYKSESSTELVAAPQEAAQ